MRDGSDGKRAEDRNLVIVDDAAITGLARWAPMAVVLCVVGGFIVLSWYAYHVGTQSVKDDDLLVVEADKTPMKEKPLDPGGMKFPNQDKTIFNTFSNSQQPSKVERVLPKPEEPMAKDDDSSETSTWINEKLQKHVEEAPSEANKKAVEEKIIGNDEKSAEPVPPIADAAKVASQLPDQHLAQHQVIKAEPMGDDDNSTSYVASKSDKKAVAKPTAKAEEEMADASDDQAEAPVETPKEKPVVKAKPIEKETPHHAVEAGIFVVQLGAYRSEEEANECWNKMHLKQKELSDKDPIIVKADLGSKGIYYRLRVGGLSSNAEAKALCAALTEKGQACIIPVGK